MTTSDFKEVVLYKSDLDIPYKSGLDTISVDKTNENYKTIKLMIRNANYPISRIKQEQKIDYANKLRKGFDGLFQDFLKSEEKIEIKYRKNFNEALGKYKELLDLDTMNYKVWYNLGLVYYRLGEVDNAFKAYEKSREINENPVVYKRLSALLFSLDYQAHAELAQKIFEIFLAKNPRKLEYQILSGILDTYLGKYDQVIKLFSDIIAKIYKENGKEVNIPEDGVKLRVVNTFIKREIQLDIDVISKLNLKSGDIVEVINPSTKLRTAGTFIPSKGDNADSGVIGLPPSLRRNIEIALDEHVIVSKIETEIENARVIKLRSVKFKIKRTKASGQYFQNLSQLLDDLVATKGDIISVYKTNKKLEFEIADHIPRVRAVRIKSNYTNIILQPAYVQVLFNHLSYTFSQKKDYINAIKAAKKAIEVDKLFAAAWTNLGYAHYMQGEVDDAIESFNKSLVLDQKFEGSHYYLAHIYYDMKKYIKAKYHCMKALEINPKYEKALVLKDEIFKDIVFCQKCGVSNSTLHKFCVECGYELKTIHKDELSHQKR